jgi:uncharacterized protein involved in type VI secretion and phage assembly
VVIAQVSDANDPAKQGRVKLTFPWLSDDYVSDWARTLQPGAGKNRGAMVLPEVGDEVLVAFEQQDPQRPYVLGGLFNGIDTPNTKNIDVLDSGSGAINRRSFISRKDTASTFSTPTAKPKASPPKAVTANYTSSSTQ